MQQHCHGLAHELWLATRELMGPARPSLEHESEVAAQWGREPPLELHCGLEHKELPGVRGEQLEGGTYRRARARPSERGA